MVKSITHLQNIGVGAGWFFYVGQDEGKTMLFSCSLRIGIRSA
jgi:hypothetical protein